MTDDLTLTLHRHIKASPQAVWRCWTEEDLLKQWFAPDPVVTTVAELDPRPGGGFRTVMQVPEMGEMGGDPGCVLLAEPAARLVWTNALGPEFRPNPLGNDPGSFAFTADIRMSAKDGGCDYHVTVFHATPEGKKTHEDMGFAQGWGTAAKQLDVLAQSL